MKTAKELFIFFGILLLVMVGSIAIPIIASVAILVGIAAAIYAVFKIDPKKQHPE